MSERVAQLEKKGLSQHEVYETLHRLHASSGVSANSAGSQILPALGGGVWLWNALIGAAVLGVGYLAYQISTGEEEFPETEPMIEPSALAVSSSESGASEAHDADILGELLPLPEDSHSATYMLDAVHADEEKTRGGRSSGSPDNDYRGGRDMHRDAPVVPQLVPVPPGRLPSGPLLDNDAPGHLRKSIADLSAAVDAAVEALSSSQEPAWAAAQSEQHRSMARNINIIKSHLGALDFGGDDDLAAAVNSKKITDFYRPDPSKRQGRKAYMRCVRKMRAGIQEMAAAAAKGGNGGNVMANGCKTMTMYLNNIINNPSVPRYHRISTSNQTFKGTLAPLCGHEHVLHSAGFVTRGAFYEWVGGNMHAGAARAETGGDALPATLPATALAGAGAASADDSVSVFDAVTADERVALLRECVRLLIECQVPKTSQ